LFEFFEDELLLGGFYDFGADLFDDFPPIDSLDQNDFFSFSFGPFEEPLSEEFLLASLNGGF